MRISGRPWRALVGGYGWVRLLPAIGAIATLGLLHIPETVPTVWDWLVALASASLVLAGARRPLAVTLAQCALLVGAVVVTSSPVAAVPLGAAVVQLLTCVALGELALRRTGWPIWAGAVAVASASATASYPLYSVAANALNVLFEVGLPILLGSFLRSQRRLADHAEQRAGAAERSRAWEVAAARAAERAVIARELHDVVAHHVAAIVLRVGVVRQVAPPSDPRLAEALDDVHTIAGHALADLRRLVGVLRDPHTVHEPGLLAAADLSAALATVLDRTRQAGITVSTRIDERLIDGLDTARRHAVLRVVQEGLTNVLKHAGAGATVEVTIGSAGDDQLVVEVGDDGGSAPPPPGSAESGHGLIVMRERVELLNGRFEAGPRGPGWTVRAALPETSPTTSPTTQPAGEGARAR